MRNPSLDAEDYQRMALAAESLSGRGTPIRQAMNRALSKRYRALSRCDSGGRRFACVTTTRMQV